MRLIHTGRWLGRLAAIGLAAGGAGRGTAAPARRAGDGAVERAAGRVQTPLPTRPPLVPAAIAVLPAGTERLDLFLLVGQSNMKGRGVMPEEPANDPRIVMMHMKDDAWYVARHPLHLVGDARTFKGHDNAGVGPGLAFAEALAAGDPKVRIGLIPCAVGGSRIGLWQPGAKLYDEALRRAKLALETTKAAGGRIRGALWLQGEADATEDRIPHYQDMLTGLVDALRADLGEPDLPFIVCTIGEMKSAESTDGRMEINRILLSLPSLRPRTACVDARDLKGSIGDNVHYDTESQNEIGRRCAGLYPALR